MEKKKFDNVSSGMAENKVLGNATQCNAVVLLCAFSGRLFHDTSKAVLNEIPEMKDVLKKYYDKDDKISRNCKNAKVRGIKRVANWINFISEVFEYIEDNRDDGYGKED